MFSIVCHNFLSLSLLVLFNDAFKFNVFNKKKNVTKDFPLPSIYMLHELNFFSAQKKINNLGLTFDITNRDQLNLSNDKILDFSLN